MRSIAAPQGGTLRSTPMPASNFRADHRDTPSWLLVAAMILSFLVAQQDDRFTVDPLRAVPAVVSLLALGGALAIGRYSARPRLAAGRGRFCR
ncbi:hypothetical protein QP185_10825 [Sphingomonas aerolata]|uniref:hypothetical protein n=1 Tax=Sphingomonas aerolata TaxID=185951 RepID=UPI002FE1C06D